MPAIEVHDYDPQWTAFFEQMYARLWPVVADIAVSIEHVGSTSVPGLAAKPIIDIDIVVPSTKEVPAAIERLAKLGYAHIGDLGVTGREAFRNPPDPIAHHLYVCPKNTLGLRNHMAVRGFLRLQPGKAHEYGELKKSLAREFPDDLDSYIEGKSEFLSAILRHAEFTDAELESILESNRKE